MSSDSISYLASSEIDRIDESVRVMRVMEDWEAEQMHGEIIGAKGAFVHFNIDAGLFSIFIMMFKAGFVYYAIKRPWISGMMAVVLALAFLFLGRTTLTLRLAAWKDTWPSVQPLPGQVFLDRYGAKPVSGSSSGPRGPGRPLRSLSSGVRPRRVHPDHLREQSHEPPLLSLVFVRWNGTALGVSTEGDGSWGSYGSPPSDMYLSALVEEGVKSHPQLGGAAGSYEVLSLFVRNSKEVASLMPAAPWLRASLHGQKRTLFWMVWPAEWQDTDERYYAGYVDKRTLFDAMRTCEEAGLHTGFPHPSDLYELITSKTWMASLCTQPSARLPAATLV
ncbi:unnamed protein product, partial [Prorocentrum cordatum]